jgi:hypothetical protein
VGDGLDGLELEARMTMERRASFAAAL